MSFIYASYHYLKGGLIIVLFIFLSIFNCYYLGIFLFASFQVIAESLSEEEIMGLKQMFKSMDTDNSGTITFEELQIGLAKQGSNLAEHEVRQLMDAVS